MKNSKHFRLSIQVLALAALSLLGYQNCAPGALNTRSSASSASSSSFADCGNSVCEVPDATTIAVADSQNVLTSMLNKAGVASPSTKTTSAFTAQGTKLPETGSVSQITAPMWMAIATMSSEVCNDLITQESATGAARRIFNSVDFTKGPSSFADAARNDVIRRMARSFWDRNETAQELTLIKASLDSSWSGTTVADTKKEMIYLCTAMMSSTDAQKY